MNEFHKNMNEYHKNMNEFHKNRTLGKKPGQTPELITIPKLVSCHTTKKS